MWAMSRGLCRKGATALVLLLAACGGDYSPNTYNATAVQQANNVARGVIVGVREIKVSASETVGAVTGGALGGIAGSQVPGSTLGEAFGTVGGTLLGGLVGAGAEHAVQDTTAYEYIVRKTNGDLVSVTQKDDVPLAVGQHVLVIAGSQARIVPDYTVTLDPLPPLEKVDKAAAAEPAKEAAPPPPAQPSGSSAEAVSPPPPVTAAPPVPASVKSLIPGPQSAIQALGSP
jgi:outer membrane lipoprotein SlyB